MDWMEKELAALTGEGLERTLTWHAPITDNPGYLLRENRMLLDLSSNDYLGLAGHSAVVEAMRQALFVEGAGSGASRLVTGNRRPYRVLEEQLAAWQQSEAALVFGSGYIANIGVIQALVSRDDVVFSDKLNHASIVDGIALSRAEHARYRHNDMEHLRSLLNRHRDKRRKLIVTDAVFSMDGDCAPLQELVALKREYGAMLMVDEAHSGGLYGPRGEGLCHKLGLSNEVDIHMGTFSKSFGVYGAYVCGSHILIQWLINRARPLIYSTALPPSVITGISQALALVQDEHWRRERLSAASRRFRSMLGEAGFEIGRGDSPIIPIIVGDNAKALRFSSALEEEGIATVAIRPPTVPSGTARIRFSLSAVHSDEDLNRAAAAIRRIAIELGVLRS
ncbi:8-amino-7-oxononanoate synthase [Paenibacillus alkaliterrae]|uniref:8-amino-7-oxononanoate synthase n=1 Tax=Paenibacillus alkaliterrae TaxID=320909 RepID=UPI001F3C8434|nr:8-amino-7-oxononanoate synthase [Paenibacillus alkaliterrae]MCF2938076.1 8-amino-7-oxononanoate synthase [Paenibacillus alkaliterrae]